MRPDALPVGLVCEDKAHVAAVAFVVATLVRECGIAAPDSLTRGPDPGEPALWFRDVEARYTQAKDARGRALPKLHGWVAGRRALKHTRRVRQALVLFEHTPVPPTVLVAAHDDDDKQGSLAAAVAQVRLAHPDASARLVVASPAPEVEAWYVAGFAGNDPGDARRLAEVERDVGLHLAAESERLTSTVEGGRRDAKAVYGKLFGERAGDAEAALGLALREARAGRGPAALAAFWGELVGAVG